MSAALENAPDSLTPGFATPEGTAAYRDRFAGKTAEGHFRPYQDLWISSIGIGTYLGDEDDETDHLYREAVGRCAGLGCNVVDTAVNYRCQRSERAIGEGLRDLFSQGEIGREEVIVATSPDLEGDGTALYVERALASTGVRVSRIARGVPTGYSIQNSSTAMLQDALRGRALLASDDDEN